MAIHTRVFGKNQTVQNALHAERLLDHTPKFKMQRIIQLINGMDVAFSHFIEGQDDENEKVNAAYQIFTLLKTHSKGMLVSAVRELNGMGAFKIKALLSLLNLPLATETQAVWPKNQKLLDLTYEERNLNDYDPD